MTIPFHTIGIYKGIISPQSINMKMNKKRMIITEISLLSNKYLPNNFIKKTAQQILLFQGHNAEIL